MGLEGLTIMDELYDPVQVFFTMLWLGFVPFLIAATVAYVRRPGHGLDGKSGSFADVPVAKRFKRRGLIGCGLVPVLVPIAIFYLAPISELLTLPFGGLLVLGTWLLAAVLGTWVGTPKAPRHLSAAAVGAIVIAAAGSFLFSLQFDAPEAFVEPTAPAGEQPGVIAEPTTGPTLPPAVYDPSVLELPTGTVRISRQLCLTDGDDTPVAVKVSGPTIAQATLKNGTVRQIGTINQVRPCDGDAPLCRAAPGSITQFDGHIWFNSKSVQVAVLALVTTEMGEELAVVWHGQDDVIYAGTARVDQLRQC